MVYLIRLFIFIENFDIEIGMKLVNKSFICGKGYKRKGEDL